MTTHERFVQAIRKIEASCPCKTMGGRSCVSHRRTETCLCRRMTLKVNRIVHDCLWTGHAAARELVEAFVECRHEILYTSLDEAPERLATVRAALLRECGMIE